MEEATAICSRCGYDLRGIDSERCPECGFELAKQNAISGEIPWTYRRARGRVRSFIATVWKIEAGGPWMERVVVSPISTREARAFWWIASTVASLPLIAAFLYITWRVGGLWFVTYVPDATIAGLSAFTYSTYGMTPPFDIGWPAWVRGDLVWPISAGWSRPGLMPILLWLFVALGNGAMTYLFHPASISPTRRQRANAFSYYLCAPMVVAAVPLAATLAGVIYKFETDAAWFSRPGFLTHLAALCWAATMVLWFYRLIRGLFLTTRCGAGRLIASCVLVPVLWFVSALFTLVFIPWCVGTAWLLLDAWR